MDLVEGLVIVIPKSVCCCSWYFIFCVSFNDAVSGKYYMVSAVNEGMSMEHWWNYTDTGRLK
jgi:hypothetical protein